MRVFFTFYDNRVSRFRVERLKIKQSDSVSKVAPGTLLACDEE